MEYLINARGEAEFRCVRPVRIGQQVAGAVAISQPACAPAYRCCILCSALAGIESVREAIGSSREGRTSDARRPEQSLGFRV